MSKPKRFLSLLTLAAILSAIVFLSRHFTSTRAEQFYFDWTNENRYVGSAAEIEKILSGFPITDLEHLPPQYIQATKMGNSKYKPMLKSHRFFKIKKKDVYRKIVGNTRIKDLISRDDYFYNTKYNSSEWLFWGIDKRVLFKVSALQDSLEKKGYNRNGFSIGHGHRHPAFNEKIGGAPKSCHILGEAVDMNIQDINKDGRYTEADKAIVMKICEEEIIKDKGGVGKYPGTRTVHMDVRGYKARWDSF